MKLHIKTPEMLREEQAQQARLVAQGHARALLESTDWMVVRRAETGEPIPPEVSEARKKARELLNE